MSKKKLDNFFGTAMAVSGMEVRPDKKQWVKLIHSVDESKNGGYMFQGVFVKGHARVERGKGYAVIVMSEQQEGRQYALLTLYPDDSLSLNQGVFAGRRWAYDALPHVEAVLKEVGGVAERPFWDVPTDDLLNELAMRYQSMNADELSSMVWQWLVEREPERLLPPSPANYENFHAISEGGNFHYYDSEMQ